MFKRALCAAAAAICAVSLWAAGCGEQERRKEAESGFYTLEEAYDSGYLLRDDLMHIAYFRSGEVYTLPERSDDYSAAKKLNFVPATEPGEPDEDIENEIKRAYYALHTESFEGNPYSDELLEINFYGQYGNLYAVTIESPLWNYTTDIVNMHIGDIFWMQGRPDITLYRPADGGAADENAP